MWQESGTSKSPLTAPADRILLGLTIPSPHRSWGVPGNPARFDVPSIRHNASCKSEVMLGSIRMSYCCQHKGEAMKADGGPWIIATTLTFLRRDQAQALQGSRVIVLWNTFLWFLEHSHRDLHSGVTVAENPSGTCQIERKRQQPQTGRANGGNAIPQVLCNSHLRERLSPSWTPFDHPDRGSGN